MLDKINKIVKLNKYRLRMFQDQTAAYLKLQAEFDNYEWWEEEEVGGAGGGPGEGSCGRRSRESCGGGAGRSRSQDSRNRSRPPTRPPTREELSRPHIENIAEFTAGEEEEEEVRQITDEN